MTKSRSKVSRALLSLALCLILVSGLSMTATAKADVPADKNFELKIMSWQGQNPAYWDAYQYGIDAYMAKYPNVKITHIYQPLWNDGYVKLLDTQFVAHKAPDVIQMQWFPLQKYSQQDFILNLDSYYQQKSAYSDAEKWIDTFRGGDAAFNQSKANNKYGSINFVPVDGGPGINVTQPFFYNKDILEEAGVTELPSTWPEFMAACEKIKQAGYTPVAADNGRWLQWCIGQMQDQFGEKFLDGNYEEKFAVNTNRNPMMYAAFHNGLVTVDDPISSDITDLLIEFSQYWQEGWAGTGEQQAQQLFMYKGAAFLMDGNWNYGFYQNNLKGVNWGVTLFPLITKNESEYAEEARMKAGDMMGTYGWAFNADLQEDPDKLAVAIDFFQFLTSPEVMAEMSRIGVFACPIVDVQIPDTLLPFVVPAEQAKNERPFGFALYGSADNAVKNPLTQDLLTGQMNKEDYLVQLYESAKANVDKTIGDAIDEEIGLPVQIANVEKAIADLKAENAPEVLITSQETSLANLKLTYEFYQTYVPDMFE